MVFNAHICMQNAEEDLNSKCPIHEKPNEPYSATKVANSKLRQLPEFTD